MKLIEWMAAKIGWSTDYHVSWKGVAERWESTTGSGIYSVAPWITAENYNILRDKVAESHGCEKKNIVITSITKL